MPKSAPILPLYLHETNVFDMLAMMSDGISTVESVTSSKTNGSLTNADVGASLSSEGLLSSFFKIGMNASITSGENSSSEQTSSLTKIHTSGSLLFKLIETLRSSGLLLECFDESLPEPGTIISIQLELRPVPIIDFFEKVRDLIPAMDALTQSSAPQQNGSRKKAPNSEMQTILKIIDLFLPKMQAHDSMQLIGIPSHEAFKAVLQIDKKFVQHTDLSALLDGTYTVLAKVAQTVNRKDQEIDFIRNTTLNMIPDFMNILGSVMSSISSGQEINVP